MAKTYKLWRRAWYINNGPEQLDVLDMDGIISFHHSYVAPGNLPRIFKRSYVPHGFGVAPPRGKSGGVALSLCNTMRLRKIVVLLILKDWTICGGLHERLGKFSEFYYRIDGTQRSWSYFEIFFWKTTSSLVILTTPKWCITHAKQILTSRVDTSTPDFRVRDGNSK